ncbi:hypothetical protein PXX31_20155, partial [Vibrio cholerae]|uniref:hypothetical protein n=1 Tax=Vibrio cholerae TaxID=666 RepID=UPI00359E87CB
MAVWQTILPQFIALGLIGARRDRERSLSIPFLLEAAAVLATLCFANAQSMTMERNENLIRNDLNIAKS